MRRRVGIHGATDETLALLGELQRNPDVEIAFVYDPDPDAARARLGARAARLRLDHAARVREGAGRLDAVVEGGVRPPFASRFPDLASDGVQVVDPHIARLLWGFAGPERRGALLRSLRKVLASYDFSVDHAALYRRLVEIAVGATRAECSSLLRADASGRELHMAHAVGIEPELWPVIRVPLGAGLAGAAAAKARPLRVRGRADPQRYRLLRPRRDVAVAVCLPLLHEGRLVGVLNLHHRSRTDAFSDEDLAFAVRLAEVFAALLVRAQAHAGLAETSLRDQLQRVVRERLGAPRPLAERAASVCAALAQRAGRGVARIHLLDPHERLLRPLASSLAGAEGGDGGAVRVGEGTLGRAAARRAPVLLRDGDAWHAALPLVAGRELVGVLCVEGSAAGELLRDGPGLLREIAGLVAGEMARSRGEERLRRRAARLAALHDAGLELLAADGRALERRAVERAAELLEADHALLRLRDPDSGRLVARAYSGAADGESLRALLALDRRLCGDALERRAPLLRRIEPGEDEGSAVRAALVAPLRRDGRVQGTLALYDKLPGDRLEPEPFDAEDAETAGRLAALLVRLLTDRRAGPPPAPEPDRAAPHAAPAASPSAPLEPEIAAPDGPAAFRERVEAALGAAPVAVVSCRIENLRQIEDAGGRDVRDRVGHALAAELAPGERFARTGVAGFGVLLVDPDADARFSQLARGVADRLDAVFAKAHAHPVLVFGYAVHPDDGRDADALLAAAALPRLRLV